jgi:pyruvate dehydrogenase (quinone)
MGMPGITITDPEHVKEELEKAFLLEGPVLIEVWTDSNALAMLPKLEFDQLKGYALYMGRMMLSGRMDEVSHMISSKL